MMFDRILCEYRNERRDRSTLYHIPCYDTAVRFLMDVGERAGRTVAICEHHYDLMTSQTARPWKEISREEYEVSRVHES